MAVTEDQKAPPSGAGEGEAPPAAKKTKEQLKAEAEKEADLSEEDLALKRSLEMMVERVQDADPGVQKAAIASIGDQIRSATTSMTSVPKPLKFLRAHYETLKASVCGAGGVMMRQAVAGACFGGLRAHREGSWFVGDGRMDGAEWG